MPGGTPATRFRGPVLHTGGMEAAKSYGASFSPWASLPIGFEDSSYYWWRNFCFNCGADCPGATTTIGGSTTTNFASNLNPWVQTNAGTQLFDINTATFPSSLKLTTGATSGNSSVSSLSLTGGNTGLSVAAKRLFFSAHFGVASTTQLTVFFGFVDTPSNLTTGGNVTDGWGFLKAAASTSIVPVSVSNTATALNALPVVTGSTTTTVATTANAITLHVQGEYLVGTGIAYWCTSSVTSLGGPTVASSPPLVGYTNTSTALPLATDQTNFVMALRTNTNAAVIMNVSQVFVGIEY